ncbi:MAG TPA: YebC/PmpR family DNA-binding transcriptional regulator [bacterium]|nr:YebC/PmpR family DNA-binding transcriptional regulator [bacterium]
MSGHSKWHSIKHKKAAADSKRGKMFTKIIREIQVAARIGGGDLSSNPRLRNIISEAKSINMPKDNIEKAIKKGTGELEGSTYEEKSYEGYGPGGVAIFIQTLTDNGNRTTAEIRHLFSRCNGNLGTSGSVSWMFERKGIIVLDGTKYKEEQIFDMIIEANADNIETDEDELIITTTPENFEPAKKILESNNIEIISAKLEFVAKNKTDIDVETGKKLANLVEKFEEQDDVQNVYFNADIPDEALEE